MINGDVLPGFEGALVPAPPGKKGWGILYNSAIRSSGRINFTLGNEFGHYLLHRLAYPKGFQCSSEDMAGWESAYDQLEHQANVFAATILMPLDDFRQQTDERHHPSLDELGDCADRYEVSLIAAMLRWLQYTGRRAVLVISKDRFILWARSSEPALQSRLSTGPGTGRRSKSRHPRWRRSVVLLEGMRAKLSTTAAFGWNSRAGNRSFSRTGTTSRFRSFTLTMRQGRRSWMKKLRKTLTNA